MQKSIPAPIVAAVIAVLAIIVGIFLYRGATGGMTTNAGPPGSVQATPPGSRK